MKIIICHFANFEQTKKINSRFVNFEKAKKINSRFVNFEQAKKINSCFIKFEQTNKNNSCFAETFLQHRDFSTIWRLFYDVETFPRCRDFYCSLHC